MDRVGWTPIHDQPIETKIKMNKIDKPKKQIDVDQFNELVSRLNHSVACKTLSKKTAEAIIKDAARVLFKERNIIEK